MLIFDNPLHHRHQGRQEMYRGRLVPCHEKADRLNFVAAELRRRGFGDWRRAEAADGAMLARIHAPRYLDFLAGAWAEWVALDPANAACDILPSVWPIRGFRHDVTPRNFAARAGLFSFDAGTPLTEGSWEAARAGAYAAIGAAKTVSRAETAAAAFVLTRPPGHHAGPDFLGGYCFLNNAALAAQTFRDAGFERVAILDIDYHHGNGTQTIFFRRSDVLTVSLHGDPRTEYPFFLGYADERGEGAGEGYNLNLPLPHGTDYAAWSAALGEALAAVRRFGAQALVVALGVDTFAGDPISGFTLQSDDYLSVGQAIAALRLPAVFVLEGGYAVAEIGINVANVLEGFAAA
jgi:acetoin utilization deacetylase AcuC-like enzyme